MYGLLSMLSFRSLRSRVQGVGETDGERVRERERERKRETVSVRGRVRVPACWFV